MVRCLLALFGTIMYIRLPTLMGTAGLYVGCLIIVVSGLLSILTSMSLAAVATNGKIKGGGTYFLLSRTLGPVFGGPIGITIAFTDLVASAMIVIGVSIVIRTILTANGYNGIFVTENGTRIIGILVILVLGSIIMIGLNYEAMAMLIMLIIMIASFCNFIISLFLTPNSKAMDKGYTGPNVTTLKNNLSPDFGNETVFSMFGVFFPAMSGILAGVNISGNLKRPQVAIPKGTLLATSISTVIYLLIGILCCCTMVRKIYHEGNLVGGLVVDTVALNYVFGNPIVTYCGALAATLSSVSAVLVSGPKVFQAVCRDDILPNFFRFFAHGSKANDDPRRLYIVNFILSLSLVMIGKLDAVAHLVTNFTLVGYAFINFACFYASYSKSAGWRPRFRYYNHYVALSTAIICILAMFVVNVRAAVITITVELILLLYVKSRKITRDWGSSADANKYKVGLNLLRTYSNTPYHAKTFRPQCLILSGPPNVRSDLVQLFNEITKKHSLSIVANIVNPTKGKQVFECMADANVLQKWLIDHKIYSFYTWILEENLFKGARALMECSGFGGMRPNILVLGFKHDWKSVDALKIKEYVDIIHDALDMSMGLAITRLAKGSDQVPPADFFPPEVKDNEEDEDDFTSVIADDTSTEKLDGPSVDQTRRDDFSKTDLSKIYLIETSEQKHIDVWWLFEDGGLTLLLPYLLSTRKRWRKSKLRVFIPSTAESSEEHDKMAHMLDSFRIRYDQIFVVSNFFAHPSQDSMTEFDRFISDIKEEEDNRRSVSVSKQDIDDYELKKQRSVRLKELLNEYSIKSHIIFITLPVPQQHGESVAMYLALLDFISKDLPPVVMLRGNHENVLTYYA
ncbi:hypothetical protein ACOME3_002687 [Neoechinorhynchus agilis]